MENYLSVVEADYNYNLILRNQNVMPEYGEKKQIIHRFDDGGISVTRMSDASFFEVKIEFTALLSDDAETLLDLWHDENKANGSANTFYWQHPITEVYYTVRFMDIITRKFRADYGVSNTGMHNGTSYIEIEAITLRIEGTKS